MVSVVFVVSVVISVHYPVMFGCPRPQDIVMTKLTSLFLMPLDQEHMHMHMHMHSASDEGVMRTLSFHPSTAFVSYHFRNLGT